MGTDPLSFVRPGQDADEILLDSARVNGWQEATNFVRRLRGGPTSEATLTPLPPGVILVRNDTGADRDRYAIVALGDPVFTRSENIFTFQEATLLKAIAPAWPAHFHSWGVLLEPLRANRIGRCLVSGIGVALVNFASAAAIAAHQYALVNDANYSYLESGFTGHARILARDTTAVATTRYWCKIMLGAPGINEVFGTLDGSLAQGSSATMSVFTHDGSSWSDTTANITVYDRLLKSGATAISSGKWCVARWYSGRWWAESAECN